MVPHLVTVPSPATQSEAVQHLWQSWRREEEQRRTGAHPDPAGPPRRGCICWGPARSSHWGTVKGEHLMRERRVNGASCRPRAQLASVCRQNHRPLLHTVIQLTAETTRAASASLQAVLGPSPVDEAAPAALPVYVAQRGEERRGH